MRAATLYAYNGQLDRFHQLCSNLVERFAETNTPDVAEKVAKSCVIAPPQEANLLAAGKLADKALTLDPNYWNGTLIPWAQCTKALVECRSGNERSAIEWAQRCVSASADVPVRKALALGVIAVAHVQLGGRESASKEVAKFTRFVEEQSPLHTGAQLGDNWHDWLICEMLLREISPRN